MMTTDGKSVTQFKVLETKANLFAGAIIQIHMQRYDATTSYNCYYLVSIGYTIAGNRFSFNQ
jgi:hypothetical protein